MFSSVRVAFIVIALFFIGSAVMCSAEAQENNPLNGAISVVGFYSPPEFPCYKSEDIGRVYANPLSEWILMMGNSSINTIETPPKHGTIYVTTNVKLRKYSVLIELPNEVYGSLTCIIDHGYYHPNMIEGFSGGEDDEGF